MKLPFYIAKLKKAKLYKKQNQTILEVWFNKQDFIEDLRINDHGLSTIPWIVKITAGKNPSINFLEKQLKQFTKTGSAIVANAKNPLRWVGAGSILFLKDKKGKIHIVVNRRHKTSTWGGYLSDNGGFSSSIDDALTPSKLATRELKEEVVITKQGKIIKINNKNSIIVPIKNPTKVVVHFEGKSYTTDKMNLIIDTKTATIDLRQIVCLTIDQIENIKLEDGETMFINKTDEASQKRQISIFPVSKIKQLLGRKDLSPTLRSTLENYFN